jgi:acyl dehydratase
VTISWTDLQAGIKALVLTLSGAGQVMWEDEQQPFVNGTGALARCQVFAMTSIGQEESIFEEAVPDRFAFIFAPSPVAPNARAMDFNVGFGDGRFVAPVPAGSPVRLPSVLAPLYDTALGLRGITLRVKVEAYDQRPDGTARAFLERLRTRVRWKSSYYALAALGLGLEESLSLIDLSRATAMDSRVTSVAALDLRFNRPSTETDPTPYSRITAGTFDVSTR